VAARAIWKGNLKLGRLAVPVKLYSAITDRDVHFHLLEKRSRQRVKQHMVHPETGEEVSSEQVQKGLEVEPGTFVILKEEELQKLEPQDSRDIELLQFLPPQVIDNQWYERPYYLGPDGDTAGYFALAEALEKQKKEGLARWVMRDRRQFGALWAQDGYLTLITLRNADEVLLPKDLPAAPKRSATAAELRMAKELIGLLEGPFDPSEFHDEYRERVLEFLEARAKGRRPKLGRIKTRTASRSLESDLGKSIEAMRRARKSKERDVA